MLVSTRSCDKKITSNNGHFLDLDCGTYQPEPQRLCHYLGYIVAGYFSLVAKHLYKNRFDFILSFFT